MLMIHKQNCMFFFSLIYLWFLRQYLSSTREINWLRSPYAANGLRLVWILNRVETRWERWNEGLYWKRKPHFTSDKKARSLSEYPTRTCKSWLRQKRLCSSTHECIVRNVAFECVCMSLSKWIWIIELIRITELLNVYLVFICCYLEVLFSIIY